MFPVTITLHNADQLNTVLAALASGPVTVLASDADAPAKKPATEKKAKPEATEPAKKPDSAATASADTATTAATTAAPEKKAEASATKPIHGALTPDERNVITRKAINAAGRDSVLALLAEYGVTKASEITDPDTLAVYDLRLSKLAGE